MRFWPGFWTSYEEFVLNISRSLTVFIKLVAYPNAKYVPYCLYDTILSHMNISCALSTRKFSQKKKGRFLGSSLVIYMQPLIVGSGSTGFETML